jgi:1,2-phenylacetyl-CoA epoxidase catalytic subunit
MMHRGALRIHETLKGKTREEQLAYWRDRHAEAVAELKQARDARPAGK